MKKMIISQLTTTITAVVILTLAIVFMFEVWSTEKSVANEASDLLWQIKQILQQNSEELARIEEDHHTQCVHNAQTAAYILSNVPSIMSDLDELKKIAVFLQVDEIHIFDETGKIVTGTEPKYYGYTFNSGEQIGFFLPMLKDKSLSLCQDITPNTAESKLMQYAAVWNEDGTMIVQIGMEPVRVLELTKKNELSYIFSLLTADAGSKLFAADGTTGTILGSTDTSYVGLNLSDIGLDIDNINTNEKGFHSLIDETSTYCVFTKYNDILIGYTCSSNLAYDTVYNHIIGMAVYFILITVFMVTVITIYLNKNIVHGIANVNSKLTEITKGNFETTVNVDNTPEFVELSEHINTMIASILNTTDKISYILDKANLPIGVYEYGAKLLKVRATHQIPKILALNESQTEVLLSDYNTFEAYLEQLKGYSLETDPSIYKLPINEERYIKMDSFQKDDAIMGFIMDVTSDVLKRQSIENERDMDLLTQLYNRRALEYKLEKLFKHPELIKHAAMIMLDSDGLKNINDRYGHKAGDRYLRETADLLKSINAPKQIIARQGGDEFVLFFYGCESHDELMHYIDVLSALRDDTYFELEKNTPLPVNYSFGYAVYQRDGDDYITLLREADMRMYSEKRERKKARENNAL